ncbi:hypothetical protein AURDEDRAFT_176644 [Auricularia subglabra TFB-10046 SS5]|uniref:F-box domain-containing protein n=1 Tax=Auricularia subglabra (strain TFB-10046 / SS5) TaxID=717982 RepID=J0WQX7_AURST|nr:hypothetical protein AURDEDRAFT_176644 [Auricularia subglabra TFB-10046 SS5]
MSVEAYVKDAAAVDRLADDVLLNVAEECDTVGLMRFALVCRRWRLVALSRGSLWRNVRLEERELESAGLLALLFGRAKQQHITADLALANGQFVRQLSVDELLWERLVHLTVRGAGREDTPLHVPREATGLLSLDLAWGMELVIPFQEALRGLEWAHLSATRVTTFGGGGNWPFAGLRTMIWRPRKEPWTRSESDDLVSILLGCRALETLVIYGIDGAPEDVGDIRQAQADCSKVLQQVSLMGQWIPAELVQCFADAAHVQRYETSWLFLGPGLAGTMGEVAEIRRTRRPERWRRGPQMYDVYICDGDRKWTREEVAVIELERCPTFLELLESHKVTDLTVPIEVWQVLWRQLMNGLPRLRRLVLIGVETLEVPKGAEPPVCPLLSELVFSEPTCAFDDEDMLGRFLTRTVQCKWPLREIGCMCEEGAVREAFWKLSSRVSFWSWGIVATIIGLERGGATDANKHEWEEKWWAIENHKELG